MKPRTFKTREGALAFIRGQQKRVLHIVVLHDDACSPMRCACKPWFRVEAMTAENFAEGERAQAEWIADCNAKLN